MGLGDLPPEPHKAAIFGSKADQRYCAFSCCSMAWRARRLLEKMLRLALFMSRKDSFKCLTASG